MEIFDIYDLMPRDCIESLNGCGNHDEQAKFWASEIKCPFKRPQMISFIEQYGIEKAYKKPKRELFAYCLWIVAGYDHLYRGLC